MQFDPEVVALFEAMKAQNPPPLPSLPPAEARAVYRARAQGNGGARIDMAEVRDLAAEGPAGPIPLRLYRPAGAPPRETPVLVYIHGGGWVIGDLDSHDAVCRAIAERAGCLVVAVDYRLSPEHPAPAAAEDCIAALRWVASHAGEWGGDPARLAVGGDSAGGSLSAVAAIAARDAGLPLRAQILIYPSTDNRRSAPPYRSRIANREVPPLLPDVLDWFMSQYLPDPALGDDWRQSPIAAADKGGLAPALVIVAERDPFHSEGLAYADALAAAGVAVSRLDIPGMIHGFITMRGVLSAADRGIAAIADELRLRFGPA